MTAATERPLPDTADPEFAPYWQSSRAKRLVIQRCEACRTPRWPPREICLACRSFEWEWLEVKPVGHVYSWTVVERAGTAGLKTPYVVMVVELEHPPGVRFLGNLLNGAEAVEQLQIGAPVEGIFETVSDEVVLPQWRLATRKT